MKNIFSLTILLVAFSMWVTAKNPYPQQSAFAANQNIQPSASSAQQVDPASFGPDPTGVATIDQSANEAISIYPNPATSYLDVKLTSGGESKVDISLFDVTGKLLKSATEALVGDKAIRITRDNLPSGVYFLLVITSTGQQCRKVVFS